MQLDLQEIMTLIGCVKENGLSSFEYKDQDIQISMGNEEPAPLVYAPVPQMQEAAGQFQVGQAAISQAGAGQQTAAPNTVDEAGAETQPQGKCLTSPIVGTFYAAPAEDAEAFVKVGDHIEKGQVIGIVEAMKLMNEVEAEESGTVVEILVENASVVECGQPLIRIV